MSNPWIIRNPKFISREEKDKKDAQDRLNAANALANQQYKSPSNDGGGILGKVLRAASGIDDAAIDAVKNTVGRIPGAGEAAHAANVAIQHEPNVLIAKKLYQNKKEIALSSMSGERTLGHLGIDTSNLPDKPYFPLRQAVDVAAAPATIATLPLGGGGGVGVKGIGGALLRQLAKDTAAGTAGYVASEQVNKRLPESTPPLVRAGINLATGAAVGVGAYKAIEHPGAIARTAERVPGVVAQGASKAGVVPEGAVPGAGMIRESGSIDPRTREILGLPPEDSRVRSDISPEEPSFLQDIVRKKDAAYSHWKNVANESGAGSPEAQAAYEDFKQLDIAAGDVELGRQQKLQSADTSMISNRNLNADYFQNMPDETLQKRLTDIRNQISESPDDALKTELMRSELNITNELARRRNLSKNSLPEMPGRAGNLKAEGTLGGKSMYLDPEHMNVGAKHLSNWNSREELVKDLSIARSKLNYGLTHNFDEFQLTDLKSDESSLTSTLREWDKTYPPNIGGGAPPETLVTPQEPGVGLTKGEKFSNQLTKVKQFIIKHGVMNDATATPIAKEYLRINNVVKTQSNNIGKLAQHAEKFLNIDESTMTVDLTNLTPAQRDVVDALQRSMDAYDATLKQFDTSFKDIHEFADSIRSEAGNENKRFSDIVQEYGNAIANKVADKWLSNHIKTLGESVDLAQSVGGRTIPTKTVNVVGAASFKLPPEVADVLAAAVRKVHPPVAGDTSKLYTAINNTLRGLWATGDASFVGIQQLPTWADNPVLAGKVLRSSFNTLNDPVAFAKWALEHDKATYGTGKPTITEWVEHNLHIAQDTGAGTDIGGLPGAVKKVPIVGGLMQKADRLFAESGNFNRTMLADYLYDNWKEGGIPLLSDLRIKPGATRAEVLDAISAAANRATGYSNKGFGGSIGSAAFFAPRFLQSQLETIAKAATDGSIEGRVARRQLLKLTTAGIGLTVALNEVRGKSTDFNPTSSNFLRIRDIGGADISIFGPWDTLVKGIIRGLPQIDQEGDFSLGDPSYIVRSKLSPVLSMGFDLAKGKNAVGQTTDIQVPTDIQSLKEDLNVAKNTALPFSLRNVGQEPLTASASGFFGVKGAPLTGKEREEKALENVGISKSDPEYLIKRKEYLAAHPDIVAEFTGAFKASQAAQQDIAARRKANDVATSSGQQTLAQFRDNRSNLLQEQRDKLEVLIGKDTGKGKSTQDKWLKSYFKLFDQAQDPITHAVDSTKFDAAIADWTNTHGAQALDFVNKYMGAGLNPVERAYYNDLRKLDAAGYFQLPRFRNMKSGLTEDQIANFKQQVLSVRVANPNLQKQPFAVTARKVLSGQISQTELMDIINSNKTAYENPALTKFKASHRKELMWFNPNADWNSYQTAQNKRPAVSLQRTG